MTAAENLHSDLAGLWCRTPLLHIFKPSFHFFFFYLRSHFDLPYGYFGPFTPNCACSTSIARFLQNKHLENQITLLSNKVKQIISLRKQILGVFSRKCRNTQAALRMVLGVMTVSTITLP